VGIVTAIERPVAAAELRSPTVTVLRFHSPTHDAWCCNGSAGERLTSIGPIGSSWSGYAVAGTNGGGGVPMVPRHARWAAADAGAASTAAARPATSRRQTSDLTRSMRTPVVHAAAC
jgi:hypothetical protein